MSNLVKVWNTNIETDDKYVIDSNSLKRDAIVDSVMMADSLAFVADSLALELSNP